MEASSPHFSFLEDLRYCLLRCAKHFLEMRLICLLLLSSLMGSAAAQCDPLTQYERDGQCCRLCGPGTSMVSVFHCTVPQCKECGEDEYQDKYTKEPKCERQPYCDPNKNFEDPVHESKTKRTECKCKEGFHCSSKDCITCVPHKICPPGTEIRVEGNSIHDTECVKCPEGTYSNESSSKVCRAWTTCTTKTEQEGTVTSDNICAPETRDHWILGIVLGLLVVIAIAAVVFWHLEGYSKIKHYFGSRKENRNPLRDDIETEQEQRTPEENEDDPSIEETRIHLTDNKNLVAQENGKEEILSSVSIGNSEMPVETLDSTYVFSSQY